ncbi:MAG: hypothetical protein CM15mP121_2470 [Bacteroidota bacterium]|nr:MAG: hypothetical protein CM15mP121_2470 [Bacteroidota bacterium]
MFKKSYGFLNISEWDLGNVTNMSGMFDGGASFPNTDFSSWDVSNVTGYVIYFFVTVE